MNVSWTHHAGNLMVVWGNANNIIDTPTDDGANAWTLAQSIVDGNAVYLWWRTLTAADAPGLTAISANLEGANFNCLFGALEFSGVATVNPFDGAAQLKIEASGGTTAGPTPAVTTTGPHGDVVVALAGIHDIGGQPNGGAVTWTNGFTNVALSPNYSTTAGSAVTTYVAYLDQSPAGSINTQAQFVNAYTDRQMLMAAWQLA